MHRQKYLLLWITISMVFSALSCAGIKIDETTVVQDQKLRENRTRYSFPVGYETFHEDPDINYFLNRLHSYGYAEREDMIQAGNEIIEFESIMPVMKKLADKAERENRYLHAAMFMRSLELYTPWDSPVKLSYYNRFLDLFYKSIEGDDYEIHDISYGKGNLASMKIPSESDVYKGTVVIHAGYDGFKEELYPAMKYLASYGYEVISFDVPWMGRSSESSDEGFSYEWEKVVGTVLDYYELDKVSLVGISMGGWLALRAAALEPRIEKVVASSVSFDVNQYAGAVGQAIARFALKNMEDFTNKQILKQMEEEHRMNWFYDHLMHITRKDTPLEAAKMLSLMNEENLHSELVTQDVLIQTGYEDHMVPFKVHNLQVKALTHARSVTPQVFTDAVEAQNHCQVGNFQLALDLILDWLDS